MKEKFIPRSYLSLIAIVGCLQICLSRDSEGYIEVFDYYLAPSEVIVYGVQNFFKKTTDQAYSYQSNSTSVRFTNMSEQRFGVLSDNLNCSRIIHLRDQISAIGENFATYLALCNSSLISVFNYSKDSFAMRGGLLDDKRGNDCTGATYNEGRDIIATYCYSAEKNISTLTVYKIILTQQVILEVPSDPTDLVSELQYSAHTGGEDVIIEYKKYQRQSTEPKGGNITVNFFKVPKASQTMSLSNALNLSKDRYACLHSISVTSEAEAGKDTSASVVYEDTTGTVVIDVCKLKLVPVEGKDPVWSITECIEIGGVRNRGLLANSRAMATLDSYTEFNSVTRVAAMCNIKDNKLGECVQSSREVYNIQQMAVRQINYYHGKPMIEFSYANPALSDNGKKTISAMIQFAIVKPLDKNEAYLDFEQVTDKFGTAIAVKDDFVFIAKGTKYSIYSYSDDDSQTTVLISAASMKSKQEYVSLHQYPASGGLLSMALLNLNFIKNLTTAYGFMSHLPDFSGYIDFQQQTAFNENYLYGNNIELAIKSNSNHASRVIHEEKLTYKLDVDFAVGSQVLYFANKTAGVLKANLQSSNQYFLCGFWCNTNIPMDCSVTPIEKCRNYSYIPIVNKVVAVDHSGMKGVITIVKQQTSVEIIYYPDNIQGNASFQKISNSEGIISDVVYYVLGNDGYMAISFNPLKSPAQIRVLKFKGMGVQYTEFYNITAGSSALQSTYFCPTKLDVCPDNPSVLDVLSDCPGDTRILKYIMMLPDSSYNLFDMNTLNHPFIPPGQATSGLSFCAQGNEMIVSAKVGEEIKVYGRTTEKEGVESYHTFNFQDFGIDSIMSVVCLNYMRGFAIYGKNAVTNDFVVAVLVGNKQGDCNKKFSKISALPALPQGSFSVSGTEVITYYGDAKNAKLISVMLLHINGPLIFTKFFNDAKFDNKMKLVIDRSRYGLTDAVLEVDMNLMPAVNVTSVVPKKKHDVQKANYCLDELFQFDGHVLSVTVKGEGEGQEMNIAVSQRLASYFSALPNSDQAPKAVRKLQSIGNSVGSLSGVAGLKFNRLFDLGDRLIGLASTGDNSYIYFYEDYYSQKEKFITIENVVCQNIEVSKADDFYFMVLKCNSQNVYSVVWVIADQDLQTSRLTLIKRFLTDKVDSVGIGREGNDSFIIAANMVSGLQFTVVNVTKLQGTFVIESEKNLSKFDMGRTSLFSVLHRVRAGGRRVRIVLRLL